METQTDFAKGRSLSKSAPSAPSGVEGSILQPGHAAYDEARRVWNAMIDRTPSLIVRCKGLADVQTCVLWAREQGMAVTVRGGGHNIGGRAVSNGALLLDFSEQRQVLVDHERRVADVSPGALLRDVDRATAEHSLVLPTGIVSETGIAGLTLGGGFGWLSRRFGLTCDHLMEAEVVTGEGECLTANEREHSDLLWALRGGGGGGAVVTNFRFRLRPLDPLVTAGLVVRQSEQTADAVQRFRASSDAAPEEMTCMLKLCAAPPAPFLPKELHGKPVGIALVCHSGERTTVGRDLDQLRTGPAVVADLIQQRPFAEFQAMFDAGEPKGRRDYWKSEYVSGLDDKTTAALLEAIQRLPSPHANVKIFQLGGAVTRFAPDQTAAASRDARFIIVIASAWEDARDDARNIAWVRDTWALVHRRSSRGGYINFLTQDADAEELARAQIGVDLERLEQVRRRYDPAGILRGLT